MKDPRYKAIKSLIESKNIQNVKDIFTIIPASTVKDDMKVNYNTLRRKINNVDLFTVKEIRSMAKLFDVQEIFLFQIMLASTQNQSSSRRK